LEVFGSPARTPAYLGSHVVHGPASENLHNLGSYRNAILPAGSPHKADMHAQKGDAGRRDYPPAIVTRRRR